MSHNISIAQYLADPLSGPYVHCNNFYDWFCSDKALIAKQKSLDAKVRKLIKSDKINVNTMYVWYKNNCPMNGSLYDDIRICDMITGHVLFNIVPKCGRDGQAKLFSTVNEFESPIFVGSWKDLVDFFTK